MYLHGAFFVWIDKCNSVKKSFEVDFYFYLTQIVLFCWCVLFYLKALSTLSFKQKLIHCCSVKRNLWRMTSVLCSSWKNKQWRRWCQARSVRPMFFNCSLIVSICSVRKQWLFIAWADASSLLFVRRKWSSMSWPCYGKLLLANVATNLGLIFPDFIT